MAHFFLQGSTVVSVNDEEVYPESLTTLRVYMSKLGCFIRMIKNEMKLIHKDRYDYDKNMNNYEEKMNK